MKNDEEIRTESEDSLVELLQSLADMDITFKALKETDIGRHVNRLWKNPSNDVRRLIWLMNRLSSIHPINLFLLLSLVPDFAYSPNPHNGSSGSDKNNSEPEPKAKVVPRRDAPPAKPTHSIPLAASAPPRKQEPASMR
ncbi:hypothetical protein ACSBR2_018437 [Camellia fascicularis]